MTANGQPHSDDRPTGSPLLLRMAFGWSRVKTSLLLLFVSVGTSSLGYWLLACKNENVRSVGTNLIADGLMILVTVHLVDRLGEARLKRQQIGRYFVVYKDARTVYTVTLSIWARLLVAASGMDREENQQGAEAEFLETYGENPFSHRCVDAIREMGARLSVHPRRDRLLLSLKRDAVEVYGRIESLLQRHGDLMEPGLFVALEELRESALLLWLRAEPPKDLGALGRNIVFSPEKRRDLMSMFSHARSDPRPLVVLPYSGEHGIDTLIPLLADCIDKMSNKLLLRDAYYMPRTISMADGLKYS